MKIWTVLPVLAWGLMIAPPAIGQYIFLNLSIKVVLNPADGTRPPGVNDADIDTMITGMNAFMGDYLRGFRFRRVEPIRNVGGIGDTTGPSRYYNVNFITDNSAQLDMEDDAQSNPSLYRWNSGAINIYVNGATGGGNCAFAPDELVAIGGVHIHNRSLVLHELGHYFGLYHTQGRTCGCCDDCTSPESDEMTDTLPDRPCWNEDGIANNAFGLPYAALATDRKNLVDDVFHNIMSYHSSGCADGVATSLDRLTEMQLDRWTDTIFSRRRHIVSGIARFADHTATCVAPNGLSTCLFLGGPFPSIEEALRSSSPTGGDIVMIKAGSYNEAFTSDRPVTLRATRGGAATIGR